MYIEFVSPFVMYIILLNFCSIKLAKQGCQQTVMGRQCYSVHLLLNECKTTAVYYALRLSELNYFFSICMCIKIYIYIYLYVSMFPTFNIDYVKICIKYKINMCCFYCRCSF